VSAPSGSVAVPRLPQPRDGVETAFLAPEAVLLDTVTGTTHHLNPGASAVWMLLDGEQDVQGVAGELADLFGRPLEEMAAEVETAVVDFAERGLLDGTRPTVGTGDQGSSVLPRPPDP
jgi:hypothetical protein